MEKKNNTNIFLIIIIVVLLLLVGGLGFYIFNDGKSSSVLNDNQQNNLEEKDEGVSLSVDNAHIQEMFRNVHPEDYITFNQEMYGYKKRSVEEMDEFYKSRIAENIYGKYVSGVGSSAYIDEKYVKIAYESIFGEGTYKTMESISYNYICGGMKYVAEEKKYVSSDNVCGGASGVWIRDEVIDAIKYKDRIEIISANVVIKLDDGNFYKTYETKDVVGNYAQDNLENKEKIDKFINNEIPEFIRSNKDKLQQYKFIFKLDKNGFYYYTGYERIKE